MNEMGAPMELIEYRYREKFRLSNAEMMDEPLDKFFINLKIMSLEAEKQRAEERRMERDGK